MKDLLKKIIGYFADTAKPELIVSLLVMFIIAVVAIILGIAVKKADPKKPPKLLALFAETIVCGADNKIKDTLGTAYLRFSPYFVFLLLYVPMAFVIGLFGLPSPMTYFTIPLCLAFVTWLGIQISAIRYQKLDYLKSFVSPLPVWLPVFVPINILGKCAPLMSLSIRLFGNAVAGYILMWLVYWGTGMLSEAVFNLADANIFGMVIAPWLHAYFDAFGAFVQTTIFTSLTLLLIASEVPVPVDAKEKKGKKAKKASKEASKA